MKKAYGAVAIVIAASAGTAFAGMAAGTGIVGSPHDMSRFVSVNADSMERVCVFCHTPHHAQSNLSETSQPKTDMAPLWNRDPSLLNYKPYLWVTPSNQGTDQDPNAFRIVDPLIGPTRLCMSCHDGVIAIDQHGGTMPQRGTRTMQDIDSGRGTIGSDLTTTHPVGFDYIAIRIHRNSHAGNRSDQDSEIVDPNKGFATAITISEVQGTYNYVARNGSGQKRIKDVLYNGAIMTCATCHEVHNKENASQENFTGTGGSDASRAPNYLLYAKEKDSLICLSCHVK